MYNFMKNILGDITYCKNDLTGYIITTTFIKHLYKRRNK